MCSQCYGVSSVTADVLRRSGPRALCLASQDQHRQSKGKRIHPTIHLTTVQHCGVNEPTASGREGRVRHRVVASVPFLDRPSTTTRGARRSLTITRSLGSALSTRHGNYINVTTGVVNIPGHVVTFISRSFNNHVFIVFGPRVATRSNTFSATRNYLSLRNRHHAIQCRHVRISCVSQGFHRHRTTFANFATRVVRRRVSRYSNIVV